MKPPFVNDLLALWNPSISGLILWEPLIRSIMFWKAAECLGSATLQRKIKMEQNKKSENDGIKDSRCTHGKQQKKPHITEPLHELRASLYGTFSSCFWITLLSSERREAASTKANQTKSYYYFLYYSISCSKEQSTSSRSAYLGAVTSDAPKSFNFSCKASKIKWLTRPGGFKSSCN